MRKKALFTTGWVITAADEDATAKIPAAAWKPGTGQDGAAEQDKDTAEITHLLTRAENWPDGLRWIVRRVKPSRRQARNLTAFEKKTGWRYNVICTNIDAAHRKSPGVLIGVPHLVDSYFIAVGYGMSRTVSACRGGSLTVAAAGGTSQATRATGLRQCGQAGPAVRPASPPGPASGGTGGTLAVGPGGRATSRVAALRLLRRRGLPWARCQRCLQRALQYFCRGAAGVQVNGVPHWGQSRCSALTVSSRPRWRPCG
jgi:hypothetical protein